MLVRLGLGRVAEWLTIGFSRLTVGGGMQSISQLMLVMLAGLGQRDKAPCS